MKDAWNIVIAGLFVFAAVLFLTVAVNMASDYKHAQILVAPGFGELADQAWDSWRDSVVNLFGAIPF